MSRFHLKNRITPPLQLVMVLMCLQLKGILLQAQTCPANATTTINAYPNTYYPGATANLPAGSTSITLGAAGYGSTPISSGDLLLLIQMQGVQIGFVNDSTYGKGVISGGRVNGYLNNASYLAGNMEYVVATNAVPLAGGTLNLLAGTTKTYQSIAYTGGYGQYTYQVIRVAAYYNLILGSTITVPSWNGATGGVLAIYVTNNLNMNTQTISAAGAGFRGGGGVQLTGGAGGSPSYFRTLSAKPFNGSKAEGIAGTPRYVNNGGVLLDYGAALEGYPVGSFGMGAPGNAGAGGTDGSPTNNAANSGGGGGSNGGIGGKGGNSWFLNTATGGEPGAVFAEASVSRLVMGGGGGAGTTNDGTGVPGAGFASSGAAGGGIVFIYANKIINSGTIDVSGAGGNTTVGNDASGGGGAGGSVIISATSGLAGVTVNANGGTGGSNNGGGSPHGPGGGGGAGVIYSNSALNAATSAHGGGNGTTSSGAYGAVSVTAVNGILVPNQVIASPMSCAILPVGFLSLSAIGNAGKVNIAWQATNEINVVDYLVERSEDGLRFTPLGTLIYRFTGNAVNDYFFTDLAPVINGTGYYRIRALDNSGRSSYSNIASVQLNAPAGSFYISPNPANASASLNLVSPVNGPAELRLLDMAGQVCWRRQYMVSAGANVLLLEDLYTLRNGMYLLQYNDRSRALQVKLLIRH